MNVNEVLSESLFFGMILSLLAYKIGFEIQKKTHENVFVVSARSGEGIEELRNAIIKHFDTEREYNLIIPYSDGSVLNVLYQKTKVISAESMEDGTHMKIRTDASFDILNRIEKYVVEAE